MRIIQRTLFILGLGAFAAALVFVNDMNGQTFYRVGISCMVTSIALGLAWPGKPVKNES